MGCPFWHGLHGHCVLTAQKEKWAISLSSRISRSLVLLPQFLEGVCPFRHGLHGHCILTPKKKRAISLSARIPRSLVLLQQFSEGWCPFRHGLHGHCVLTAPKKKKGYIALVEDFTEFGPASTIFRRGVSVSAQTSRTLPFDGQKKKLAISLSSRISWSLVLLPQFSEG